MKLVGDLAKKAEKAETKEELKEVIKEAGIELEEGELDSVSGGIIAIGDNPLYKKPLMSNDKDLVAGHL